MVGRWVLVMEPDVWRLLGADAGAADADGAVVLAAAWAAQRGAEHLRRPGACRPS